MGLIQPKRGRQSLIMAVGLLMFCYCYFFLFSAASPQAEPRSTREPHDQRGRSSHVAATYITELNSGSDQRLDEGSTGLRTDAQLKSGDSVPQRKKYPIDVKHLKIHNGFVPDAVPEGYDPASAFSSTVFGVLSDGILATRLEAAFQSWLRQSYHTFVFFSDIPLSREVGPRFERPNVTMVYLTPPPSFKFGNWKNLPIIQHLASTEAQKLIVTSGRVGRERPLWYVVVDDDTYLLAPAVHSILSPFEAQLTQDPTLRLFLGHTVIHCLRCKTASKRFPFAFGGNGIFMSAALLHELASKIDSCRPLFHALPGDEQVGGCIHRYRLATLKHMSVGTETFAMAFGDKKEVLLESPFPFSFHRIKFSAWHRDMHRLERRHEGKILSWEVIAAYFMDELRDVYNIKELVFQEDINTTEVQRFLATRGLAWS